MAGTIIDTLIVELELDPSQFSKQQQEVLDRYRKTVQGLQEGAKATERSAKQVTDAISGIKTQALEMFAAVAGGKSILDFSLSLTKADASLGRLERNLGQSASTISAWQGAARIFGGDAATMAQSFTSISDAFAGWKIGVVSPLIADLRAISTAGGTIIDVNKGVEQSFMDLSANLKAIHDKDPAQAGLLGRRIGLDPALFDMMIKGPAGMQQVLDYVRKIGVATKETTDTFGELEKRINQMGVKAESLGRKLLTGENGRGGAAAAIMEMADVLNMTPSDAWKYLNRTDRMALRNGDKKEAGTPGSPMFQSPATGGAFTTPSERETFIRNEAAVRGVDPNIAMRVARSEGFSSFYGDNNTSFGAYQLHVTPGGRGRAVGDQFRTKTGLDPSDPANERDTIRFALDDAKRNGWGAYHGAARVGIPEWAGLQGGGSGSSSTSTTEVNIGTVQVTAPAGSDPNTFAARFGDAIRQQSFAAQANNGQN